MPLDGAVADARLGDLDHDTRYASLHLALPDGTVLPGGWGLAATMAWLPGLRWMARLVAGFPLGGRLLDRLYWFVAPRRGKLARFVPDVDAVEQPGRVRQGVDIS